VNQNDEGIIYDIDPVKDVIAVGRSKKNDIVLTDDRVSRKHAELRKTIDGYVIVDLGSHNGTCVNSVKIKEYHLKNADNIKIGSSTLIFIDETTKPDRLPVEEEESDQAVVASIQTDHITGDHSLLQLDTEAEAQQATGQRDLEKINKILSVLYQISSKLNRTSNFEELLNTIMDLIFQIIEADYGFVAVLGESPDEIIPKVIKYRDSSPKEPQEFKVSRTIIKKVIEEKSAILTSNVSHDPELSEADSVKMQNIRSVISVPLWRRDDVIGMIQINSFRLANLFRKADLDLLSTISSQIAMILEQAHLKELNLRNQFVRETFGRYLSDQVVNTILESPEGLNMGAEKREVTIMMADLRGFTALSERLPAEDVVTIINIYLEAMTEVILKYQGTIDEIIGDAILAIFGAPIKRYDDAKRAVACAMEMQKRMAEVNNQCMERGYPQIEQGIGINTGVVAVGNIGSKKRTKYGIVGSNVNLTARIESYTVGGQTFISENTLKACGPILRIDDKLKVLPKGVKEPITVYEVGGIGEDYNIYLPEKEDLELFELEKPLAVSCVPFSGKHIQNDVYTGDMVKLSDKGAEIRANSNFKRMTDLKFILLDERGNNVTEELYAKVVKNISDSLGLFVVRFTSVPLEARTLFEGLIKAQ
jgi:adenylate cyclase